jgi:hypothetical protein
VVGRIKKFPVREAAVMEAGQLLLTLVVVFVGARLLKAGGETFHSRHNYPQAFTTVVYSLSPLFLMRLLNAFNGISPWVSWAIGIILSIAVLYNGLPQMMDPDPPHAFGLFFISALLLTLVTGLLRLITWWYFRGGFPKLQAIVSHLADRLP